jgi:hypothetical protein
MEKVTSTFMVKGEDGGTYTVLVHDELQEVNEVRPLDSEPNYVTKRRWLTLSDGRSVQKMDEADTFKIVATDEIIRKL